MGEQRPGVSPRGHAATIHPLVLIAVDRAHRGMSQLADRTDSVAVLADPKELVPNLRVARRVQRERVEESPILAVLPSGRPDLIPRAISGGADRVICYHTADAPRSRWTEIAMRAAGALVDWVIVPDRASLSSAVRHGADPDRMSQIDLQELSGVPLFSRIALEPRRRELVSGLREAAASLALDALDQTGALWLAERLGADRGVNVINYHRVLPFEELRSYCRPQMALAASLFEAQLETMAARGFVSIDAIRTPAAAGRVAVTFDDGYEDNFRVALPLLRRFSAPACIFLVTSLIGEPEALWWDRVGLALFAYWHAGAPVPVPDELPRRARALEHLRSFLEARAAITDVLSELNNTDPSERELAIEAATRLVDRIGPSRTMLSWDEIAQMQRLGIRFGAHTRTHVSLDEVAPVTAREELLGSVDDLERRLPDVKSLGRLAALPRGRLGPLDERELSEIGFTRVMSTQAGVNPIDDGSVMVKRRDGKYLTLRGRHHPAKLRLELSGALDFISRDYDA